MAPAPEGQVVASSRCPPSTHGGPPVTTWGVITSGRGPALTPGHAASTLATATTPAPQRRHELTLTLPLALALEETRTPEPEPEPDAFSGSTRRQHEG